MRRQGGQTWKFESRPRIIGSATVVGPDEGEGPLSTDFDYIYDNIEINEKTWEKAERRLIEHSTELALINSNLNKEEVQFFISGDLMNQIISSSFSASKLAIPYLGVFGACSTSMESLALAALIVDSEAGDYVMAGTTSHNCTVEKQFRYPNEYGAQKPPTAQYTVTGSGAAIVGHAKSGTVVDCATIGRVMDMGIKDPFNMGGAMAPAAADTLLSHFRDTGRDPSYYDLIVTGDLASVGLPIAKELLKKDGFDMNQTEFNDCGLLIYDINKQKKVIAGGSGCGCSAVVTYGHLLKRIEKGELQKVLVVATGALLSPLTTQQGESIPCVAHAVAFEAGGKV
ncbi:MULTISPECIES: stage V sporulation protein AD [Paenibacillus]|uniref:stage V sporulation protein AD n=1 Tax=Paenibacillus TaxID=44249 RepID=UPI000C9F2A3D|nr:MULTISPECIES: stage V sporulation protein AD [Paenibacillus]KAF6617302.1 stage V sporulation protein AD [Paenibacillus sp. EKM101P]KAF6622104.1 stage V sporulation protein AD [Paenibacillus sp. EKM102P]KAF6631345.1 stage V sporulation protein AD [Paenibacillus sp. EKM10P]KAF6650128.1 stage V sporulation protein AD [Paenibacillus sp. EKM11P]MEE4576796.1 stage V sporulation protein AD [Paenibacillus polymyxa]